MRRFLRKEFRKHQQKQAEIQKLVQIVAKARNDKASAEVAASTSNNGVAASSCREAFKK